MAHEHETSATIGDRAWHRLDNNLAKDHPAQFSTSLFIDAAGLNWSVRLEPLYLQARGAADLSAGIGTDAYTSAYKQVRANAIVRNSDGSVLADHVGPNYVPLQNADAFKWFDPLLAGGHATLETAGSLRDGKRVWVLAKPTVGGEAEITPGDVVKNYILLAHGHDGCLAIRIGLTPTRVVCQNTLSVAIHGKDNGKLLRILHTKSAMDTMEDVRELIPLTAKAFAYTTEAFKHLASRPVTQATLKQYAKDVFKWPTEDEKMSHQGKKALDQILAHAEIGKELLTAHQERQDVAKQAQATIGASLLDHMLDNLETGIGTETMKPEHQYSWWGAYNAVTQYLTHERGKSADARRDSTWFGDSANVNQAALNLAISAASVA